MLWVTQANFTKIFDNVAISANIIGFDLMLLL